MRSCSTGVHIVVVSASVIFPFQSSGHLDVGVEIRWLICSFNASARDLTPIICATGVRMPYEGRLLLEEVCGLW